MKFEEVKEKALRRIYHTMKGFVVKLTKKFVKCGLFKSDFVYNDIHQRLIIYRVGWRFTNHLCNIHSFFYFSKNSVCIIQVSVVYNVYEKLTSVCIWSCICHCDCSC